jgi:hypothetical protein
MKQTIDRTYVTLNQAKLLKEKKFDVPCRLCVADDDERPLPFNSLVRDLHVNSLHPYYSAPEQWELAEWLRLNHGIWISVNRDYNDGVFLGYESKIDYTEGIIDCGTFNTPQEAYSAAFDYVLNNLI